MQINIHAESRRTSVSSTGNVEWFETTVITDTPFFREGQDEYNSKIREAIERLLVWKTGAGGQGGPSCEEMFPQPNEAGCYIYTFKSTNYCD
jgi:hypothetical protein